MLDGIEELVVLVELDDVGGDALFFAVIFIDKFEDFDAAGVGEREGEVGFFTVAEADAGANFADCPRTGKIPGDDELLAEVRAEPVRIWGVDMIGCKVVSIDRIDIDFHVLTRAGGEEEG